MPPSAVECIQPKPSCCVCEEMCDSVNSLHNHQMNQHSTEELSLALLNLKGHKLLVRDMEVIEDSVLQADLTILPHFLLNFEESDAESTVTTESTKLEGSITRLDGIKVEVPKIKFSSRNGFSTNKMSITKGIQNTRKNKTNFHGSKTIKLASSQTDLDLICQSDDAKSNKTSDMDTDIELTNKEMGEGEDQNNSVNQFKLECSSPSISSVISPGNSPYPDSHIKAIITRLPNIVNPRSELNSSTESEGRRTSRKKQRKPRRYLNDGYILPSPISKEHFLNVEYAYQNGRAEEGEDVQLSDFFVPNIHMESGVDVSCGSPSWDIDGKEVQAGKSINEQNYDKETQTGILSMNTQKLAAFRKPTSSSRKSDVSSLLKSNSSEDKNMKFWSENLKKICSNESTRLDSERRFFCDECGKSYKKKSHLERHVRVHTGERPFQCSHCDKRFAVRSILKQHVRTHTGEKPYCCTICQQRFPQKSGLMTHTMLHTGKPFKCDHCDKAFVSNHKLLQHLKSHTGMHKHTCVNCGTEFLTEGGLLQHVQIHKCKYCMICGETFNDETQFKLHSEKHIHKFNAIDVPE